MSESRRKWRHAKSDVLLLVRIKRMSLIKPRAIKQDKQGKSVKKEPSQKLLHSKQPRAIVKNTFSDDAVPQSAEEVDHPRTLMQKKSSKVNEVCLLLSLLFFL